MRRELIRKYIRNNAGYYFSALYLFVMGHLLLLTSAIYERGTTELSRYLIPKISQTGEMIESVFASVTVLFAGWLIINSLFAADKEKQT